MGVFVFSKHSNEFRLKVVQECLSGVGSTSLNHKYGIIGSATIISWVNYYKTMGKFALIAKHSKQ